MTRVIYKVGDEFTESYKGAMEIANDNEYLVKVVYVEFGDNDNDFDREYTLDELIQRAKQNNVI